jgi:hypothetical protein
VSAAERLAARKKMCNDQLASDRAAAAQVHTTAGRCCDTAMLKILLLVVSFCTLAVQVTRRWLLDLMSAVIRSSC